MRTPCLINGRPDAALAVDDRGLQYGDGLFETLAVRDGVCEFWDRHMQRLRLGCARLGMPYPDLETLSREARIACEGAQRGVLKIIVTRGSGGRGYRPPDSVHATRILQLSDWPEYPAENAELGVDVRLCATTLGTNSVLAGIKHLNRLEQVLARMEWSDPTIAEGLLTDGTGAIIEGTFTNIFMVQGDVIRTPRLDGCGVAGVMRGVVMELAAELGHACVEDRLSSAALQQADELFLTNSVIGIWPVRRLDGGRARAPGPVTRELQQRVRQYRQTWT